MADRPKLLAIKDWWKHQHYHKRRGAPWIKLYAALLTDVEFIQMPEAAQAQLIKLWLLASQFGHPLPNNPKLLAGKIGTTGKFHLASLIDAGFLIPCETAHDVALVSSEQNASKRASTDASDWIEESDGDASDIPPADARSRERGEVESRELELQQLRRALLEGSEFASYRALADELETDTDRDALVVVLSRAADKLALVTALNSMLSGNDPATPQPSRRQFGLAMRDLAMNGERPSARLIRGYLDDANNEAKRAARRAKAGTAQQSNPGDASYAAGRAAFEDLAS